MTYSAQDPATGHRRRHHGKRAREGAGRFPGQKTRGPRGAARQPRRALRRLRFHKEHRQRRKGGISSRNGFLEENARRGAGFRETGDFPPPRRASFPGSLRILGGGNKVFLLARSFSSTFGPRLGGFPPEAPEKNSSARSTGPSGCAEWLETRESRAGVPSGRMRGAGNLCR